MRVREGGYMGFHSSGMCADGWMEGWMGALLLAVSAAEVV